MISANELRIGNWIKHKDKNITVFELSYLIDIDNKLEGYLVNEVWITECEPIPLTPEILEKCGFESEYGTFFFNGVPEPLSLYYDKDGDVCIEEYSEGSAVIPYVKHLHQLQNLYFALTGIELDIKL